jgi:heat shock protein HslJ
MSRTAVLLAAISLSVGCASGTSSPTSPSAADGSSALSASQVDGTWTLSSIQPAGQAAKPVPSGATYNLTLGEGRASAKADCNVCSGALTISGSTLSIGPALACTRAACVTMDYESQYEALLSGDSNAAIDGSGLTLSSARGVLRFRR